MKASFNELIFVCLFQGYSITVFGEAVLVIFKEAVTPVVLQCSLEAVSDAFCTLRLLEMSEKPNVHTMLRLKPQGRGFAQRPV